MFLKIGLPAFCVGICFDIILVVAIGVFADAGLTEMILGFFALQVGLLLVGILTFARSWTMYKIVGKPHLVSFYGRFFAENNAPQQDYYDGFGFYTDWIAMEITKELNWMNEEEPTKPDDRLKIIAQAGALDFARGSAPMSSFVMHSNCIDEGYMRYISQKK